MGKLTISEPQSGRCKVHINHGGEPSWCSFDYLMTPDAALSELIVDIGLDSDPETQRWFESVKRGIDNGVRNLREYYDHELTGIRLIIPKIYSHPIATSDAACERYAASFIEGFGKSLAREIDTFDNQPNS